jgi:hypothetical protein
MRFLLCIILSTLVLTGCGSSNYRYQSHTNPQQWQGRNYNDLQKQWGMADQVMHTRTGTSYYVYSTNSTANFFNATTTNVGSYGEGSSPNFENDLSLQCTTIFQTNAQNIITSVTHKGNNCGGQWVGKAAKNS